MAVGESPCHPPNNRPKNRPVSLFSLTATSSGVPSATTHPPAEPPSGAHVDDPVGRFNHVEVVFDDGDRISFVDEAVKNAEELLDVFEVQAGRRFIQKVERLAGLDTCQLGGQFHALGFTAA